MIRDIFKIILGILAFCVGIVILGTLSFACAVSIICGMVGSAILSFIGVVVVVTIGICIFFIV